MRVAAIYDLHGNLPALEAVLEEIYHCDVDQIIVGGDIVPGPMPRETLECLLKSGIPVQFIQGNGEIDALAHMDGLTIERVPEAFREVVRWSADQLYPNYKSLIANWPKTLDLNIPPLGEVLFCHATPRDDNEIFTRRTSDRSLLPIFETLGVDLVVCGHTHMQFDRTLGSVRVVNAGSLGMPFGKPGAYWMLLGPDVKFRHTHYDLGQAATIIGQTGYPQRKDFVANNVLNPPSEAALLEIFAKAELR